MERNEGVRIVLDPGMARLWRDSGEVWKPISSRIVRRPTVSPVFLAQLVRGASVVMREY